MLTIDDVRAAPLFSTLAAPELERLAQTSADLHLASGEYAAHEGGEERALFAVLAGKMEVVKLFDGVERTLGWRVPGTIFGELPIAIGTPHITAAMLRRNILSRSSHAAGTAMTVPASRLPARNKRRFVNGVSSFMGGGAALRRRRYL